MSSAADGGRKAVGLEALHRLKSTEPPLYLTPSPDLSNAARLASEYLFASLNPYAPKSPFSQLLTEGFDAEQIWQQIDLQAQPLLSSLSRHVRNFEKNPEEIKKQFNLGGAGGKEENVNEDGENKEKGGVESESEDLDDVDDGDDEDEELEKEGEEEEEEEGEGKEEEEEEDGDDDGEMENAVEDKFLKIKELEEYLVEDEAREYGLKKEKKNKRKRIETQDEDGESEDDDDNEDGEEEDEEEEDDELGLMGLDDDDEDEDDNKMENARYEDFFGGKRSGQKKKSKHFGGPDDMDMDDEPNYDDNNQKQSLSTFEKELEKVRSEIEEMEKANLGPKNWTMQGEVTAAQRPKNSALEDPLDFVHNVRPAPAITEEVTASLEELIHKRILEGRFDDVQKPPTLATKAPREKQELDENKSKKGLAELYEDEYAQKTGLVSATLTFSDEQKKEASMLFKKLCVKLDALSHFHFTPKPVIEDMSVQANVPALAMEEIAPLAVSDAAMLAPEEVFSGKGDIKEETELTKAERKRRRAKKKRKFKAESAKRAVIKAQLNTLTNHANGNEDAGAA
ncbi:U3 small nucleolar ribonucleoprotein (snoRNP) subunit - Mpp10p [Handroanthus impetiginosus]|uniref:U3 small nucleolar ribonucleoprotein protein MPP10 n=1 Tax=Handroanthus impetiginosus TaxID=429701 RepID=A0A2G9HML3_9LAMI|nr:U3 small nucleolar ribonucleoprotein (snoRNP) subunit - Mpp10p [Handroanthus impetiginosus]